MTFVQKCVDWKPMYPKFNRRLRSHSVASCDDSGKLLQSELWVVGNYQTPAMCSVEDIRDLEACLWYICKALLDFRCSLFMRRLMHLAVLLPCMRVVSHNMDAHAWEMFEVIITQSFHALHLVQDAIPRMLHLVYFKKQEPPSHLDVEINPCTFPPSKRTGFYDKLTRKCNMH